MSVYIINSISLFTLTFCHCGPVLLSLLKYVCGDGKRRGGAGTRVVPNVFGTRASPRLAASAASGELTNVCPCPLLPGTPTL